MPGRSGKAPGPACRRRGQAAQRMRTVKFFATVMFLPLLLAVTGGGGHGATYHVDAASGDDAWSGTAPRPTPAGDPADGPWKTIARVNASQFSPGDSILFRRGRTWREQLTVPSGGAEGNPVTFGAYGTGDAPVIDGENRRRFCIHGVGRDDVVIEGLELTAFRESGIYNANGHRWRITGNHVRDGGDGRAPSHAIRVAGVDSLLAGIVVTGNRVGRTGVAPEDAVGFNGILVQGVENALISHNLVSTVNVCGIRVIAASGTPKNSGVVVEHNVVTGCYGMVLVSGTDNAVIRYNRIHDGRGCGIGIAYGSGNARVYYNLIYNLGPTGRLWNGIDVNHDSRDGFIYNNTVYRVHNHSMTLENDTAACDGWTVRNNIFDASRNTGAAVPLRIYGISGFTEDNNILRPLSREKDIGENLVRDCSFAALSALTDPGDESGGWHADTAGGKVEAVAAGAPGDERAVKLTRTGGGVLALRQAVASAPLAPYELSFHARSGGGSGSAGAAAIYRRGRFLQDDGSWGPDANWNLAPTLISAGDTGWERKTLRFIGDTAGGFTLVLRNAGASGGTVYVSGVGIYRQGDVVAKYSPADIEHRPYGLDEYRRLTGQGRDSRVSDPGFTDPEGGDFSLRPDSPALGAGADVGLALTLDGDRVPPGSAPDIGALGRRPPP